MSARDTYTLERIMALRPCSAYPRSRVRALFGDRKSASLTEILADTRIPPRDRVWIVCQPSVLTRAQRSAWLERIIARAVTAHALHCGAPQVERWAQAWLDGSDRTRQSAAEAEEAARAARAAWAARAARAARAAWAAGAAWAAWAARAAGAAEAAEAARAAWAA